MLIYFTHKLSIMDLEVYQLIPHVYDKYYSALQLFDIDILKLDDGIAVVVL